MFKIVISRIIFWLFAIILATIISLQYLFNFINIDFKFFSLILSLAFLVVMIFFKGILFNKKSLIILGILSLIVLIVCLLFNLIK